MIITFAWRNLWRNKRRSLLTFLGIGFSCSVLIFFMSIQLSSYDASINASVKIFQGYAQIQRQGYLEKPGIRTAIPSIQNLRVLVQRVPGVRSAAARGYGFGLISSEHQTFGVQVVGVEPENEPEVSTIPSLVFEGRKLTTNDAAEIIIGEALAKNLSVTIGDQVSLIGQGMDGSVAAAKVSVVGIFRSGTKDLDRALIEMPLGFFQETFAMEDAGHTVVISGNNIKELPTLLSDLRRSIDDKARSPELLKVLDWDKLSPGLKQAIELDMTFGWLFYFSLILIVALSILNTFLMSVLERVREFGLLLCLGVSKYRIAFMVLVECLVLLVIGLALGALLGGLVVQYYHLTGFSVPGAEELMKLWNLPAKIYPSISLKVFYRIFGLVGTLTLLALIYPLVKIIRLKALESLHAR